MDNYTLLVAAIALAMDAFAVSISNSMCYGRMTRGQMLATSASFGLFQGVMPIAGYFGGVLLGGFIRQIDHWLALVLLGFIGGKMLWEGIRALQKPEECPEGAYYTTKTMLLQSLATSIDALAVGIGFAALSVNIWYAASVIAGITFVVCLAGCFLGKIIGNKLGDWAQIFGGLILVAIGLKIFIEHMAEQAAGAG